LGEPFPLAVPREALSPFSEQTLLRADPEAAVVALGDGLDRVLPELRSVPRAVHGEPHAVEAHQPFLGAEPQISVAGLKHGRDGVLRETVARLPGVQTVL